MTEHNQLDMMLLYVSFFVFNPLSPIFSIFYTNYMQNKLQAHYIQPIKMNN